ncbi:MAG: hypothetical protein JXQ27_03015 [Acidobacteria bacterium]|nr:hypothetical protein [Acidobacteriota bacterium]
METAKEGGAVAAREWRRHDGPTTVPGGDPSSAACSVVLHPSSFIHYPSF